MKNSFLKQTYFVIGALLLIISGCTTTYKVENLSADEQAYVAKVNAASPVFEVPKKSAEEAWSRGNAFINQHSGMKIQSSNEYHVSTFDPNASQYGTIGYNLTKELKGKNVKFTIQCLTKALNMKYTEEVCRNNEKLMAYYMQTGELKEKFIDSKIGSIAQDKAKQKENEKNINSSGF